MDSYVLEWRAGRICLGEGRQLECGNVDFLENVHATEHPHETNYAILAHGSQVSFRKSLPIKRGSAEATSASCEMVKVR
jgi:hypothetical protein